MNSTLISGAIHTSLRGDPRGRRSQPSSWTNHLNGFEIINAAELVWPVKIFNVKLAQKTQQNHKARRELKSIFWDLRNKAKKTCPWPGFIVDLNEHEIAIPVHWNPPIDLIDSGCTVTLARETEASITTVEGRRLLCSILHEGLKLHVRDQIGELFGPLWKDYDAFCQLPQLDATVDFLFCRRFEFNVKLLRDDVLVVRCLVNTNTVDGRTIAQYYEAGEVKKLAGYIESKRQNRVTRQSEVIAVRVLHQLPNTDQAEAIDVVSCVRSLVTRRSSCAWRFQDPLWGVISRAEACGFDRV